MKLRLLVLAALLLLLGSGCTKQTAVQPETSPLQTPITESTAEQTPTPTPPPPPQPSLPEANSQTPIPQPKPSAMPRSPSIPKTPFTFASPAFASDATIPLKYTCDGADVNPSLSWNGAPENTKSFALIVNDPDAVSVVGHVVDHWVLWNIPPTIKSIAEGSVPAGASQGMSYDAAKYQGPCPPPGTTHRYFFKLYALDIERLDLPSSTSGKALESAIRRHILKQAEFIGRYTAN